MNRMSNVFTIASLSPGLLRPHIAVASDRARELGILDFEHIRDHQAAAQAVLSLNSLVKGFFGIKLNGDAPEFLNGMIASLPDRLKTVILLSTYPEGLHECVAFLRQAGVTTLWSARAWNTRRLVCLLVWMDW